MKNMSQFLVNEKSLDQHFENKREEEEEEEALSLCDLPNGEDDEEKEEENGTKGGDFDFDFGSLLVGSVNSLESEMCSADEVFSGGQILPYRHSVSSEAGLSRTRISSWRSVSRSESMDRIGVCSRSSSSRSSSIRSQYSTTSSSTSTSSNNTNISVKTFPVPKCRDRNRDRNNFHSHPSPKPQVWATGARASTTNYVVTPPGKKSTMWDVLRLGLIRTPEIELHDLKQRHRTSISSKSTFIMPRNNSTGSTTSSSSNNGNKISDLLVELTNKNKNGGFFKSCKCSVLAIEPVPTREFSTKVNNFGTKIISDSPNYNVLNEDKELAQGKVTLQAQQQQKKKKNKNKNKLIRQGNKVMSHHYRTFEWLRDLSQANVLNS